MEWTSERDFAVEGVSFRSMAGAGESDKLVILKPREAIEAYEAMISALRPRTIVELGIYGGGSAALFAQLAKPDKLVALDVIDDCPPLERFIDDHGLAGTVVPYFGVDQADAAALDRIMAAEFDAPIDLVIDDASHLEAQTRASFNRLFPHVRPGGLYVIEDWGWAHLGDHPRDSIERGDTPLSRFVFELLIVAARRPQLIPQVTVGAFSTTVRRGTIELHAERFDVATQVDVMGRGMLERMQVQAPSA